MTQAVGVGLEALGHGGAHRDGSQAPGDGVVQLARNHEAVLGHRPRRRLSGQRPLIVAAITTTQPQGRDHQADQGKQHRHLVVGRSRADSQGDGHREPQTDTEHAPGH